MAKELESILKGKIRYINDYPKRGVLFRDITPLLKDRKAFALAIDQLAKKIDPGNVDYIVGIESRGFIIGSVLAYALGKGFVPAAGRDSGSQRP